MKYLRFIVSDQIKFKRVMVFPVSPIIHTNQFTLFLGTWFTTIRPGKQPLSDSIGNFKGLAFAVG